MRGWIPVILVGCAVARPPVPRPPASRPPVSGLSPLPPPPGARPAPDAVDHADQAIDALTAADFAGVVDRFDPASEPPTPTMVEAAWRAQTKGFGRVLGWQRIDRTYQEGFEVRNVRIELESGAVACLVTVDPTSLRVRSLFLTHPAPPAAYVDRTRFREIAVRIGAPPYALDGTLVVPTGRGPFPAAVLVHGSGPNDRDESVGANKIFKDLAEGLATAGIAVLRYDKRTYTYGDQLSNAITLDDETVLDAIAAVHVLGARPEIDPAHVFVIGHSLGGLLAPEIAFRAGGVAGVALLAPPGRAPWDIVRDQMRYLHAPREALADVERAVIELDLGVETGRLVGMSYAYWRDWAARDGVAMAKRFARPVLVLHGTRDYQVTDADFQTWRSGLADQPLVELVTLPALDHLFIAGRGPPSPLEYRVPSHVDAAVIARLAAFTSR